MSLAVWLPLTGDLHNQGLNQITVTNNGATVDNNGKLGKCYSFNGTNNVIYNRNVSINCNKLSMCCWIYRTTSHTGEGYVCSLNNGSGYADAAIALDTPSSTSVCFVGGGNSSLTTTITANTWNHIAVTYDGTKVIGYLNGQKIGESANTRILTKTQLAIGCRCNSTDGFIYYFPGRINDFRLYDHALSAKEVEEIAKGLVLHYPLNNNGMGGENLFRGSAMSTADRAGLVGNSSTNWTKYFRMYNGSTSHHSFSGDIDTISLKSSGNLGICFQRKATDINLDSTSYYIISCEAKCNKTGAGLDIGLSYYDTSNNWVWRGGTNRQLFNNTTDWQKFTLKFKPDADTQYIMYCFTVVGKSGGTETFSIRHCKLEKGEKATAWAPSPLDSSYPENYKTTIYDTSGYSNNGIIVGELSAVAPSPRYKIATQFLGDSFIKKSDFHMGNTWTLSCWFYSPSSSAKTWSPLIICNNTGGDSDTKFSMYYNQTTGVVQFLANGTYDITQTTTKDAWHCIVATFDGSMLIGYIDGHQVTTKAISNAELYKTNLGIGARCTGAAFSNYSAPFEGKISDVRIYATALTAAQVTKLYNQSMIVDASGNILPRELVN